MIVRALTDKGNYREQNEDSILLPEAGDRFCAVADGMGGCRAGEVASSEAVRVFREEMRISGTVNGGSMRRAVEKANRTVFAEAERDPELRGMGTTFTALGIQGNVLYIAHVGDSRAYLVRDRAIRQITRDHSVVYEMVLRGLITEEEARVHPRRNLITRALGVDPEVEVDITEMPLKEKDMILLCTDGLTGDLTDEEILQVLEDDGTDGEKLERLVCLAMENGSTDNITVMLARFEESGK